MRRRDVAVHASQLLPTCVLESRDSDGPRGEKNGGIAKKQNLHERVYNCCGLDKHATVDSLFLRRGSGDNGLRGKFDILQRQQENRRSA